MPILKTTILLIGLCIYVHHKHLYINVFKMFKCKLVKHDFLPTGLRVMTGADTGVPIGLVGTPTVSQG